MPNSKLKAPSGQDPVTLVRSRADALYRGAVECCRQHDRAARISSAEEPESEHRHLDELCRMCDGSLAELAEEYHSTAAGVVPDGEVDWWHRANAMWHASREFARRHAGCDALDKRTSGKRSAEQLAAMQMEYELEASSLLALRHAADAYLKTRPGLS